MLVQRHKQAQLTARALLTATESLLERTRVLRAEATRLRIEAGALRIARGTRHRLTRTRGSASAAS